MMYSTFKQTAICLLFLTLAANNPCNAALMEMQVGESRTYQMSNSTDTWECTLDVIGQANFGSNTYFELLQTDYTPDVQRTLYFRSTDTEILAWTGTSEAVLFKTGNIGDTWNVNAEVSRTITGVNTSVTVPYGTFSAYEYEAYRNGDSDPFQRHYIVPELGFIEEIDWLGTDKSHAQTQALSDITTVPIPGAVILLGTGLIGLLGVRRKKNGC